MDSNSREASRNTPLIESQSISKYFGSVIALENIHMKVHAGEIMCLLGDNGAGKSTLIKILSGVFGPDKGKIRIKGREVHLRSPHHAMGKGIATVYQDLALFPMMSVARNFFVGREPITRGWGLFRRVDWKRADALATEELQKIGIDIQDPAAAVGTLSRGQQQCVAIARAVHFGARVLILDEPTSALGVKQAGIVLRYIKWAKSRGLAVIFITHNVYHAYSVGDAFTVLNRGRLIGTFQKDEISRGTVLAMMAGGDEMEALCVELDEIACQDALVARRRPELARESAAEEALAEAFHEEADKPLDFGAG